MSGISTDSALLIWVFTRAEDLGGNQPEAVNPEQFKVSADAWISQMTFLQKSEF